MAVHMGGLGQQLTAEFFNWVHAVHVKVLPLNEVADIRVWTDLNPDDGTGLLELHAPLVYGVVGFPTATFSNPLFVFTRPCRLMNHLSV